MLRSRIPLLIFAALFVAGGCTFRSSDQDDSQGEIVGTIAPGTGIEDRRAASEERPLDLSTYQVRYFTPGEAVTRETEIYEDDKPFTVTGYGPVDYLPVAVKRPSIYVTFSQPVVPLARLGEPSGSSGILTIDPPLSGVYRWYGTRLLSFDADEDVIPQRQYTVRVASQARSLGGRSLEGDREFTFRTEPLSMIRIIPGDKPGVSLEEVPLDAARNITVLFNHPVKLDVVTVYIDVKAGSVLQPFSFDRQFPPDLEFTTDMRERAVVLRLKEKVDEATEIEVVLLEGGRSEEGYIGTPADQRLAFTTLGEFQFSGYDTYSWAFPRSPAGGVSPVFLTFSHPIDPQGIKDRIGTQPESTITAESVTVWKNQVMVSNLPFLPDSTYTLMLDRGIKDMYGRSLGQDLELEIQVPEAQRYAYFPNTGARILEAEFPNRIIYEYQNVFDGVWKIDKIADPYRSFDPGELEPYDFSHLEKNVRHFEVLDLDPWLNEDGKGTVGISWNFEEQDENGKRPTWGQRNLQLQVTDLGITARIGYNRIVVLVTSLSSGEPVHYADVAIMRGREVRLKAATDANGIAVFDLEPGDYNRYFQDSQDTWKDHLRIRADYRLDSVEFVPNRSHNPYISGIYSVSSPLYAQRPTTETYLFTDRGLYRPGERVWFRGIDLDLHYGEYSAYRGPFTAELKEPGYGGKTIASLNGYASTSGGFYGSFELPERLEPGYYSIAYQRPDNPAQSVYLQVAHFEKLNFEVTITGPDIVRYLGDTLEFDVHAGYLSGGNLTGARCNLYWTKEAVAFSPPGDEWSGYSFGPSPGEQRYFLSAREGELDSTGAIRAEQRTTGEGVAGMAYSYQLEARVQDAGRQEVAARKRVFVHPASFYLAGRVSTDRRSAWSTFVAKGEQLSVSWALVSPDGKLHRRTQAGQSIEAQLYRVDWKVAQQQGVAGMVTTRYEMVEELEDTTRIDPLEPMGNVNFVPSRAGLYRVRLSSRDEAGRAVVSELDFYATGADWIRWGGESNIIDLKLDGELFTPGDTASILMKSPLPEGRYIVTVEREGILDKYLVDLEGSAQVIGIPVRAEYAPVVYVSVASYSVRAHEPSHTYFTPDLDKPKGYYGVVALPVDTSAFRIDVEIDTGGVTYLPGGKAEIQIRATKGGQPVAGAEITFLAVDRGVVDLIDYHVPDPLEFFYSPSRFPLSVIGADSRSLLIDPVTYEVRDQYGGDAGDRKGEERTRSNFVPTAVFEPALITDRDGVARAVFALPDTLTTYRCTAVAVSGTSFGLAEEELRVQQPVNVTSLLPKRIRVRDTVTAGVMVTNMDRSPHELTIGIESDLIEVDGESEKSLTVGPGETLEVTFNLYSELPGETEVVFITRSQVLSERLVRRLIVEKPTVREVVTTTGRIESDEAAVEGIVLPGDETVQDGSIRIEMSPSLLAGLSPAVQYLLDYPHDCFEQRASKLMPVVLFGDSIVQNAGRLIRDELGSWGKYQLQSGGFPFWPEHSRYASYYATLRVAHLLKIAEGRGFEIPSTIDVQQMISFLARPGDWVRSDDYLMLYSLYLRALYGMPVQREAADYLSRSDALGHAAHAFLGLAFDTLGLLDRSERVLTEITRYLKPGTRSVDLTPRGSRGWWFYGGDDEELALLLLLQIAVDPGSDLTDRIARSVLLAGSSGRWANTAATSWALLSLHELTARRDEAVPDVTARVTFDEEELYSRRFRRIDESAAFEVRFDEEPISSAVRDIMLPLQFTADGSLYYVASLAYDLPAEVAGARDEGFSVYTSLETFDGRQHAGNTLILGETYRQRVVISTARSRSYIAITVPVPSGAVILDASFSTTGSYDKDEPEYGYGERPIEKIYDNEVRYYFDRLDPGSVEVVFLFRAVNQGVFPTPPVTVECMYEPEVFGRSGGKLYIFQK